MKKSVMVVEDDPGLREQLVEILDQAPDIKCIGAFASAEDALKVVPMQQPDVVLMDIGLPGMSGIQCVAELRRIAPKVQIIMVTVYEDSERIFNTLKAGASGYLVKSGHPDELLGSVRDLFGGGAPMSSHIARKVVKHFHLLGPAPSAAQDLSPREGQVLNLLASGMTYREIAEELKIGIETVRTYVKNICQKMHVRNRVEAVARHRVD
ncbi:MAG TPA: response regulator transcription factor [Verrucomicrobiae bacterium]|jgi:DNA-binding NarL/FixJ family response regulator|nr:response regulator transcription factor [Verrucomicrobiae bacterium]